ncbi:GAF domain-containing protein [Calothrix sp. 336/3]|uniref:GAF domain-containing protein n=1 Tax=Calothrix sp. 336/3 TaxID=1337936 RepID=UPI0004E2FA25|nr:GAF domain-containing protein [Calothrix sp. 336/3]AKG24821.1 hypothetical protein IJ00_24455 [Calothrix sp. 336/3]
MESNSQSSSNYKLTEYPDIGLQTILKRLTKTMERDTLIRQTTNQLRESLQVDRVILYYFYQRWHGQVTFEALSTPELSILGSIGPAECFNDEYAALYLAGRVRAIPDIELEPIQECHQNFLRQLQVRANLAVPILTSKGLWGLLIAHHCQAPYPWTSAHISLMQREAEHLAIAGSIRDS